MEISTGVQVLSLTCSAGAVLSSAMAWIRTASLSGHNARIMKLLMAERQRNKEIIALIETVTAKIAGDDFDLDNINDRRKLETLLRAYDDRSAK